MAGADRQQLAERRAQRVAAKEMEMKMVAGVGATDRMMDKGVA